MVLADTYPTTSCLTTVVSLEVISDPGYLQVGSLPSHFTSKIQSLTVAFYREGGPKAPIHMNTRECAARTACEQRAGDHHKQRVCETNPNPPREITSIAFQSL